MSAFGIERLEERQLLSFSTASLVGAWIGTEVLGNATATVIIDIGEVNNTHIEVQGLPSHFTQPLNTLGPAGSRALDMHGKVQSDGDFTFSEYLNSQREQVTLTGDVEKNDEGQTVMKFTETDSFYVSASPPVEITNVWSDVFTQSSTLPLFT